MRVSLFIEAVAAAVLWLTPFVEAFKMESVLFGERQVYHEGDRVPLKFNKLTSTQTLLPIDPYQSNLGLCEPKEGIRVDAQNLGEYLQGDRIQASPYIIKMKQDEYCKLLCVSDLGMDPDNAMVKAIRDEYTQNWLLDNQLPAASKAEDDCTIITRYFQGVPLGLSGENDGHELLAFGNCWDDRMNQFADRKVVLHNHVNIEIHYQTLRNKGFAVTRFVVEPFSIRHEINGNTSFPEITTPIASCRGDGQQHTDYNMLSINNIVVQNQTNQVAFTYDVIWLESDLQWSDRWKIYLEMDGAIPSFVHLSSIINSCIIIIVTGIILCKVWRRNISGYSRIAVNNDDDNETSSSPPQPWHLIKNDVFRAPTKPFVLAVGCGNGAQFVATAAFVIFLAMLGWANQSHSGALTTATIAVHALTCFFNGLVAVYYYRIFQGKLSWKTVCLVSSMAFPLCGAAIFLGLQLTIFKATNTTYAMPLLGILLPFLVWTAVSLPLAFLGGLLGRRISPPRFPTQVNEAIREIPPFACKDWFWTILFIILCGPYPFGSFFVELYYILSSAWQGYYYNAFSYLALVLLVTCITCAATTILFIFYFVFRKQNHYWWWRAYIFGCISGMIMMVYSFAFMTDLGVQGVSAFVLYFSDMLLLSLAVSAALGFVAVSSAMWFSRRLYGVFEDESLEDHIEMNDATNQQWFESYSGQRSNENGPV